MLEVKQYVQGYHEFVPIILADVDGQNCTVICSFSAILQFFSW